jgi:hypothetical protein
MAETQATEMVDRLRKQCADAPDVVASAVVTTDSFFLSPRTESKLGIIFLEISRAAADLEAYAA